MTPSLFGIFLHGHTWREILTNIEATSSRWIVTANPEMLLAAYEDASYREVVLKADERTIDGFGLWLVLQLKGFEVARLTGVDLGEQLLAYAGAHGWRVALFGGEYGVAQASLERWKRVYPALEIRALEAGSVEPDGGEDARTEATREEMLAWKPHVLLVALGGGTKQERWIARHRELFRGMRVIVGVGGAFDMWAGRLRRAPRFVRMIGLEWFWRLMLEPSRLRRIWRATAVFFWRAMVDKTA